MAYIYEAYDVAVIGAGHAGCEAALAAARLGLKTIVFTVAMDSIAMMPCNPNIGGTSKGHLVRELDALGGEMGKNIDRTFIQSRMLNESKGPAVHSLRAQADKREYSQSMRHVLENTDGLTLKQAEITEVITNKSFIDDEWDGERPDRDLPEYVCGVRTASNAIYPCKCAILCTGVYLKARCIYGEVEQFTGPNGLPAANHLTESLKKLGIEIYRFKTGTPARIDKRTIDFSKMEEQPGDEKIVPFSFENDPKDLMRDQVSCWLTYTNEETHKIIRENIDRSPLFNKSIQGTGPRYCPSIEDKVVRFADKERHQVFIEPEGLYTNEMYLSGMSSSMPEDVQIRMYRTVPGLENAQIVRNAYAIEYDCINPMQLKASLEFKDISGFFSAGQANGSSGYEEAAAQGIIAGINAAMKLKNREPLVLKRSDAYIGVLIDDLVTKETHEPYRMMTSRAEYRLLLRQDNADLRLSKYGHDVGLLSDERYRKVVEKERMIREETERLASIHVGASKRINDFLVAHNSTPLNSGASLADLLRRSELSYKDIHEIDPDQVELPEDVTEQIEINLKYEGYIKRQFAQVEQFKKLEVKKIPEDVDYNEILSLRLEAKQKLSKFRPESVGQAARISGVSPADISVLLVYLEQRKRK
ncbi:MAG: tRNA uridine-5-carboxymethylaminomethyl(34) synthesis enzyme MnmG [Lachnospiraceae bacterium]|nr:tRNA uridine-5-carboxymethylaminomethyl(34) synthesis enzyme MnmG [Lachnospiraceae bacterium]